MSDEKPILASFDERAEHVLAVLDAEEAAAEAATPPEREAAPENPRPPDHDLARREREVAETRARLGAFVEALVRDVESDPVVIEGRQTDWTKLRQEDPGAFARKFPAYRAKLDALEAARGAMAPEQRGPDPIEELDRLLEKAPELVDPASRRAAVAGVRDFLASEGYTREQIGDLVDHRIILIARDAMRWREQERTKKATAAKKVVHAPRTQKPGGAGADGSRTARLAALKQKAMQTGKLDDRAAYVLAALDEEEGT